MIKIGQAFFRTQEAADYYKWLGKLSDTQFWREWNNVMNSLKSTDKEVQNNGCETGCFEG